MPHYSHTCDIHSSDEYPFEDVALSIFQFQATQNPLYQSYLKLLRVDPAKIESIYQIPFLPINFFKSHQVITCQWPPEAEFISSSTTGSIPSRHVIKNINYYLKNTELSFNQFFGNINNYHFLALLPSYLERQGSSLITMMDYFIKKSNSEHSGFYLFNHHQLIQTLQLLKQSEKKVMLWGVSFALMDLAEHFEVDLSHCVIMETGGMKGKRKELTREELHLYLSSRFNVPHIASEYGMTELLSQAYAIMNGQYQTPKWMKILIRDINDPFQYVANGKTGAINVIDLANIDSCSFIETHDLGKISPNGYLEVLGRIDNSDLRGCNFLVE